MSFGAHPNIEPAGHFDPPELFEEEFIECLECSKPSRCDMCPACGADAEHDSKGDGWRDE